MSLRICIHVYDGVGRRGIAFIQAKFEGGFWPAQRIGIKISGDDSLRIGQRIVPSTVIPSTMTLEHDCRCKNPMRGLRMMILHGRCRYDDDIRRAGQGSAG